MAVGGGVAQAPDDKLKLKRHSERWRRNVYANAWAQTYVTCPEREIGIWEEGDVCVE